MQHLRSLVILLAAVLLQGAATARAENDTPLQFGVYPYLSPNQIVRLFSPLREQLETVLARRVVLRSAPDFKEFMRRTQYQEYDIIFTAPHMGRLAQQRDGYRLIAQTGYKIVIVALTRQDSPVSTLGDLKGRSIAVGARWSMSHLMIAQAMTRAGLQLEKDVKLVDAASFSNVLQAVLHGDADAGVTGTLLWDAASAEERRRLREIFRSEEMPGFFVLAHPRLGEPALQRLREALYGYAATAAGKDFFTKTQTIDFRPVDAALLPRLDPLSRAFDER